MASAVKSSRRSLPALLVSSSSSQQQQQQMLPKKKLSVPSGPPTFADAMTHDLDLYYIRQIASHMKEFDLEQKIDVEIRIREGTTKLLAACQHPSQALEAAKTLQTSNERMNVYTSELQRRKQRLTPAASATNPITTSAGAVCSGRLGLTDLRLPLMWKDTDHFKNRGDYRRFAVFLLAKVGTQVLDTSLITPVDRSATDITFPDNLVFASAKADFNMKLEVYSCMLQDDLSIASTPRKLQKSLHTSISRTLGRKLSATLKDPSGSNKNASDIGPKFDLVATATLSLAEVHDSIKSHDLVLENLENPCHQLPLFDHFCCRLAAEPECLSPSSEQLTASVTFLSTDPPSSTAASTAVAANAGAAFAAIRGFDLQLFKKKAHRDKGRMPLMSVSLSQVTAVVEDAQRGSCSFTTYDVYEEKRVDVFCSDADWLKALSQRIVDAAAWGRAVTSNKPMVIHSPQPTSGSPNSRWAPRSGSLYEDTPLFEEPKSNRSRPTVHEVFNLARDTQPQLNAMLPPAAPPSPPNTRSRSSSTSTSSSSLPSWGSVRGLPNFWRFARASIRK